MKTFSVFFIIFGAILFFNSSDVNAENNKVNISVAPAVIEVAAEPGQTITKQIKIRSSDSHPLPMSVESQSLASNDEYINFSEWSKLDAKNWIKFPENNFIVNNNTEKLINFTINVPKDAKPGGKYAQISVRALSLEKSNQTSSIALPEVVVSVLINVKGNVKRSVFVQDTNIFPWRMTPGVIQKGQFYVYNTGGTHELVSPILRITSGDKLVQEVRLKPVVVLPDTKRKLEYEFKVPTHIAFHKAQIILSKSNPNEYKPSKNESFFVADPIFKIIAKITLVILFIYFFRHRRNIKSAIWILLGR